MGRWVGIVTSCLQEALLPMDLQAVCLVWSIVGDVVVGRWVVVVRMKAATQTTSLWRLIIYPDTAQHDALTWYHSSHSLFIITAMKIELCSKQTLSHPCLKTTQPTNNLIQRVMSITPVSLAGSLVGQKIKYISSSLLSSTPTHFLCEQDHQSGKVQLWM